MVVGFFIIAGNDQLYASGWDSVTSAHGHKLVDAIDPFDRNVEDAVEPASVGCFLTIATWRPVSDAALSIAAKLNRWLPKRRLSKVLVCKDTYRPVALAIVEFSDSKLLDSCSQSSERRKLDLVGRAVGRRCWMIRTVDTVSSINRNNATLKPFIVDATHQKPRFLSNWFFVLLIYKDAKLGVNFSFGIIDCCTNTRS
jgi:hypothetical protein